ncbi:hypothetical protein MFUM_170003 [Methylacidiphilum fumariolicum SolV]|uniref:Uncharacterized protein n=2 Tax=Candidatus Methylacidiphilum fumarolicum TaxID=591154 RepID=I0JWH1_METFB|nr:conserved protein of unknown function [Candidatus Methylacidiphilum fumarolicum]CCG91590.1 hypothetical protein MFUM_170003 [Methylacidiphilum fumariolicum SolV]
MDPVDHNKNSCSFLLTEQGKKIAMLLLTIHFSNQITFSIHRIFFKYQNI